MSEDTVIAYIGLGSNLGDRQGFLDQAVNLIGQIQGTRVHQVSAYACTRPLANADQPEYLNGVARVETTLPAQALFAYLMRIEDCLGRERSTQWASRTIDLDLLLYGDRRIDDPDLTVPHPAMHLRAFVLEPLAAMSPDLEHPVLHVTMEALSQRVRQGSFVLEPHMPQLISIAGNIGVGKTTLADGLARTLQAEVLYEPYDTNPFMPEVYAGKMAYALDSELYFLVNRAEQVGRDRRRQGAGRHRLVEVRLCASAKHSVFVRSAPLTLSTSVGSPAVAGRARIQPSNERPSPMGRTSRGSRCVEAGFASVRPVFPATAGQSRRCCRPGSTSTLISRLLNWSAQSSERRESLLTSC